MKTAKVLGPLVLLGVVGCGETPVSPINTNVPAAQAHEGLPASSCTLAPLPATAHVIACFTTTLQPGVWHGFLLELATAQPPGNDGDFTRARLNHQYLLASPQGFTKLGPLDTGALFQASYAFQAEFNGTTWFDVVRLYVPPNGASQTVSVVVYWLDADGASGEFSAAVTTLLDAGVVNAGQANALTRKISQAMSLVAKGQTANAITVLQGLIQQLNDLTSSGVLTTSQAELLVGWAQYIITDLGGVFPPPASSFAGAWSGTYDYGPMSALLQQNGSAVTGTVVDAVGCIWTVNGTVSGNTLPLPNWVLQSGTGICVGGSVSMTGSLDAGENSWIGTGLTTLAGGAEFPWTFSLVRQQP